MFKINLLPVFLVLSVLTLSAQVSASSNTELDEVLSQADKQIAASDFEAARNSVDSAIKIDSTSSRAYQKLAALQIIGQDYSASVPNFQKAIGLDQKNGGAFLGLGFAYLHMGKYGPAHAALSEAKTLMPARKQEIHQIITWIDKRSGAGAPTAGHGASVSMPETVKAAAGHNKK